MLTRFIADKLKMELSTEKPLITHSNDYARFLGYDIRVRRNNQVRVRGNHTQRTLSNSVELNIPLGDKIMKFMFSKGIIEQGLMALLSRLSVQKYCIVLPLKSLMYLILTVSAPVNIRTFSRAAYSAEIADPA